MAEPAASRVLEEYFGLCQGSVASYNTLIDWHSAEVWSWVLGPYFKILYGLECGITRECTTQLMKAEITTNDQFTLQVLWVLLVIFQTRRTRLVRGCVDAWAVAFQLLSLLLRHALVPDTVSHNAVLQSCGSDAAKRWKSTNQWWKLGNYR